MPTPIANTRANRVSSTVPGKRVRNSSVTGLPVVCEVPKSSQTARPRKRRYCSQTGWSRPNARLYSSILAGVARSPSAATAGPPGSALGERTTPARSEEYNRAFGLDKPLYEQYLRFIGRAVQLDFGTSRNTGRPVTDEFLTRFPGTVELTVFAMVFAIGVGIPLGYLAARKHGSWIDSSSVIGSLLGVTIPVFFLAYILRLIFAVELGWLPGSGRQEVRMDATHITNFYVFDGLITREWDAAWDAVQHLILPGVALGTIPLAIIVRITRASVLDVVNEDYVRTAQAKGLANDTVRRRHILRNALLPVATTIGLQTGLLLSGAVLTETVFAFGGVGSTLRDAISTRDYALLQGFILILAVVYVLVNLLVDISYGILDPRVRVR